ncbi:cobalamin biosynthesis protein [Thioclava sp.]|uniref:cobalamin biosynthesis protein n=1 Tax=Thioclava sp. TaxID=1933450 RepID=UPI003AA8A62A
MRVVGLGFRGTITPKALAAALEQAGAFDCVATAAQKASALAAALPGVRVVGVDVAGVATPTQSKASLSAYGTGSVAEAAALIAAGAGARLCHTRRIIGGVTIARAQGDKI